MVAEFYYIFINRFPIVIENIQSPLMKKIYSLLIIFFTIVLIISCQKEFSSENGTGIILPPPPPSTVADSNFIDTLYEFETRGALTDTTAYFSYKYDTQKRLASINWEWGDFLSVYDVGGTINFFYNGADSLPFRSLSTALYEGKTIADTSITFYYYDVTGGLIKDSVINSEKRVVTNPYYRLRHYVNTYSYAAGKVFRQASDLPVIEPQPIAYPPVYMLDTAIIDANQNPVTTIHYVSYNNNTSFFKDQEITIVYDNKPNPFYKLNIYKAISPIPDQGYLPNYFTGRNNYINYSTGTSSVIYTNAYLTNGYIKKVSYPATFDPSIITGYIYIYRAL